MKEQRGYNYSGPRFLVLPHPLTNFKIQNLYQKEPKLNGKIIYLKQRIY